MWPLAWVSRMRNREEQRFWPWGEKRRRPKDNWYLSVCSQSLVHMGFLPAFQSALLIHSPTFSFILILFKINIKHLLCAGHWLNNLGISSGSSIPFPDSEQNEVENWLLWLIPGPWGRSGQHNLMPLLPLLGDTSWLQSGQEQAKQMPKHLLPPGWVVSFLELLCTGSGGNSAGSISRDDNNS